MQYKVWAEIERQPEHGECENVDEPVAIGYFDTIWQARAFVDGLSADGYTSLGKPKAGA